jgi:hypothetical protein
MKPKWTHEVVRGTPIAVDGRVFVPEARVTSLAARELTYASGETRLAGVRMARVRPTALIEQTPGGERRHRIKDETRRALIGMIAGAVAAPVFLNAIANRLSGAGSR